MIKKIILVMLMLVVCALLALLYAVKIEPYLITVKEHSLGEGAEETLRIVQISDIQISDSYTELELKRLIEKVNKLEPDLFFFTGDLYENFAKYGPKDSVIELLSQIEASYGKYAIWGNRDYGGGCARHYEDVLLQSGFLLLKNEAITIEISDGRRVFLAGLDDALLGTPHIEPIMAQMKEAGAYSYAILMLHEPDIADHYADSGFDLMVAGHSHGGQVRIPFTKGMTTAMAEKYVRGFYDIGDAEKTKLYVNTGIGTSHYPVRFLVVPEITVFQLKIE